MLVRVDISNRTTISPDKSIETPVGEIEGWIGSGKLP